MIADFFSSIAKKPCNPCNRVTEVDFASENNELSVTHRLHKTPKVTPPTPSVTRDQARCNLGVTKNSQGSQQVGMKVTQLHELHQKNATVGKTETGKNNSFTPDDQDTNNPPATAPLPTRTEPPEPGSTAPFNQEALDAVKAGSGCWVWSGILEAWLFWVRDEERKTKAIHRGIDPGCVWTLEELTGVQGMPPEGLRDVAKIKRRFAGTVQPGEVPARWRDALQPLEPAVAEEVRS